MFFNYLKVCWSECRPICRCYTLAASLVRYEYDIVGKEISRTITTHLFQAETTKNLLLHMFRPNF